MKKHINDCTWIELNTLAAKMQGWDSEENEPYDPCHDGQQAMDLLRRFHIDTDYIEDINSYAATAWIHVNDATRIQRFVCISDTPEIAIVKAVIVSKFGEDVEI